MATAAAPTAAPAPAAAAAAATPSAAAAAAAGAAASAAVVADVKNGTDPVILSPAAPAAAAPVVAGYAFRCPCGKAGVNLSAAAGPTGAFVFECHCSICRTASGGLPSLPAIAAKPAHVTYHNEQNITKKLPAGSQNIRLYCALCSAYVAEDATKLLGLWGLPLHRLITAASAATAGGGGGGATSPPPQQLPPVALHIFFGDRVRDVTGSDDHAVPKWKASARGPNPVRLHSDGTPYVPRKS